MFINKQNTLLTVDKISLRFGGLRALDKASFEVEQGSIFGLIGPNGSGKTCVLNCINRFYHPEAGRIFFDGIEISNAAPERIAKSGVARTFQNIALFRGMTVLDNIKVGRQINMESGFLSCGIHFGKAQNEEIRERKFIEEEIIDVLQLEAMRDSIVGTLPYGKQKLVELARALALQPKLLLLDEPSAGMNQEETEDIIRYILDIKLLWSLTIILVEHNMEVVTDICDYCCVLNYGRVIALGLPADIQNNEEVIKAYIGE
ncbi:MAG: ABC transporter ATP-binding protein [Deltaproteobacteria bacterium]|nr:ABC transporter ATP-binding protein [Deltaproteobacteria bacterium]